MKLFSFLFFLWVLPASAAVQTIDVGPWEIRLEAGEHAVMEGPETRQKIKLYRGKQLPLMWSTQVLGKQSNDSVRKLQQKWRVFKGSIYTEDLQGGRQLYRFENQTMIYWLLKSGELLTLEKRALSENTVQFDLQRVSVH